MYVIGHYFTKKKNTFGFSCVRNQHFKSMKGDLHLLANNKARQHFRKHLRLTQLPLGLPLYISSATSHATNVPLEKCISQVLRTLVYFSLAYYFPSPPPINNTYLTVTAFDSS